MNPDVVNEDGSESNNQSRVEEPQTQNLIPIPAFLSVPAELKINYNILGKRPDSLTFNGPIIQEINFRAEVNLEPFYFQLQEVRQSLNTLTSYIMETPSEFARHVGNELVGETYLRWDSRVQFYPTITFIFLESEDAFQARRLTDSSVSQRKVQVKLRIIDCEVGGMSEEQADRLEDRYRDRISRIIGLSFLTGQLRCTYVNPGNIKWKTTLFIQDVLEAQELLGVLCSYGGQEFYPDCLTYTSSLKNEREKKEVVITRVSLWKVSLLINKKAKQIVLYHVNTD